MDNLKIQYQETSLTIRNKKDHVRVDINNYEDFAFAQLNKGDVARVIKHLKAWGGGCPNEATKALPLHSAVGQSEQLKAFRKWYDSLSQEELVWYKGRYEEVFLSL